MLNKLKKNNEEGFTIIEVLIVLAIGGLILLIVFLAIPALQRNSRNTTLKADASAAAGGVGEFAANNNGASPKSIGQAAGAATGAWQYGEKASYTASTKFSDFKTNGSTVVLGAAGTGAAPTIDTTLTTPTATKVGYGQLLVLFGQDCTPASNPRATAIYYVTEGSSATLQCSTS